MNNRTRSNVIHPNTYDVFMNFVKSVTKVDSSNVDAITYGDLIYSEGLTMLDNNPYSSRIVSSTSKLSNYNLDRKRGPIQLITNSNTMPRVYMKLVPAMGFIKISMVTGSQRLNASVDISIDVLSNSILQTVSYTLDMDKYESLLIVPIISISNILNEVQFISDIDALTVSVDTLNNVTTKVDFMPLGGLWK